MRRRVILSVGLLASLDAAVVRSGGYSAEVNYTLNCRGCHLGDGRGTPGSVPPLIGIGRLVRVASGREYITRVPGVAQAPLDDAEVAAVLNWVLQQWSTAELPDAFVPFTADEVARGRKQGPLVDVDTARRAVVEAVARVGAPPAAPHP